MTQMNALIYEGPQVLTYRRAPMPEPASDEVLIKITAVGICGSDMHGYLGHDDRRPAPLILGHEAAGTIVSGPRSGERVTINPLVTCGTCEACLGNRDNLCATRQIISMPPREGAFADYIAMPERNLVTIPDGVAESQACMAEPIACGWHTARLCLQSLWPRTVGIRCLVIGGGAIGVGAALALKAQGVESVVLVEPNDARRAFINAHCGIEAVTEADLAGADPFCIVIDGVGFEATRALACAQARPGGAIGHIGLGSSTGGLDVRRLTLFEIAFIGTYTYTMKDFRDTAAAIFDGKLGDLSWVEERPLSDGAAAFADIRAGLVQAPKIILNPTHKEA